MSAAAEMWYSARAPVTVSSVGTNVHIGSRSGNGDAIWDWRRCLALSSQTHVCRIRFLSRVSAQPNYIVRPLQMCHQLFLLFSAGLEIKQIRAICKKSFEWSL